MTFSLHLSDDDIVERPSLVPPSINTHKYRRGHAVIYSGPALHTGASRLCAQAALAVGAGLVTIVGERAALTEHAAQVTAIMLRECDAELSVIDDRTGAMAIGPGAGVGPQTVSSVLKILKSGLPVVLDADALTSFSDAPETLFAALHPDAVLTPHEGEFARLFPDIALDDRFSAAKMAAARSGVVMLLKGADTVIAAPDGRVAINRHASPWLATAGSGDVLAGMICGLLAQGSSAFDAAAIGAWLHGDIGVRFGPGLTADIMTSQIPLVLQGCLAKG